MNMTTTENIVRQMTKKEAKKLEKPRDPIMATNLKRGQRVQIYEDPTKKDSLLHGNAKLLKLNDAQVYHDKQGYENWRVEMEDDGQEVDRIISVRHTVAS